jgi:AcrR family transcriptional regulator
MSSQRPKTDKRSERSRAVVLAETYRQLSQSGLANVSIDEISRVSGVSKTTIYRHWPSRSALLIDACSRLGGKAEVPDTGSLRADLHALLSDLAVQLGTASWSSVVPSIVDAAERDSDVLAMQTGWHQGLMQPFTFVLEHAKARGDVAPNTHPQDMIAMTVGAFFYRRWFSREPIDTRFVEAIVSGATAMVARKAQ